MDGISEKMTEYFTAAARLNARQDGDYIGEDGLLYCGKCKTSKQVKGRFMGEDIIYPCMCDCKAEEEREKERQARARQRERYIDELRHNAFPRYSEYSLMTFDNADNSNEKQMNAARRYCEQFKEFEREGKGLLLYGNCGTGKSYIAACIANRLIDNGIQVMFTTLSKISNRLQRTYDGKGEIYDELRHVPLLILDDFRSERSTEFMQEVAFEVVNGRIEANRPLIVTTNLTAAEIKGNKDRAEQRIMSRLLQITIPIEFEGEDKRIEAGKRDYAADKARLGL